MIPDARLAFLSPSHHHFAWVPDPWHYQAFVNNPAVVNAVGEGRLYQIPGTDGLRSGPWMELWYSVDREGKLLGEWGQDMPASVQICLRCKSPNISGASDWCSYCGVPYAQ